MQAEDFRRHVGISFRQLDTWTNAGYLRAFKRHATGSGHPREWSMAELIVAKRIKRLVAAGLRLNVAAAVARESLDGQGEWVKELGDGVSLTLQL